MKEMKAKKRAYVKPSMEVYLLNAQPQILAGSMPVDPNNPTGDQW